MTKVIGAEGRLPGCDDVLQELVAGAVAFRVVHGFHLVDVDERDDEGCAFPSGVSHFPDEGQSARPALQRPSQRVEAVHLAVPGGGASVVA